MATVGQVSPTPDAGWKRYDSTNVLFTIGAGWNLANDSNAYMGSYYNNNATTNRIEFYFYGTALRIISPKNTNGDNAVKIIIDGVQESFSVNGALAYNVITYEKSNLENKRHVVSLYRETGFMWFDAIDVNSEGRLLHSQEVLSVADLEVGKRIRFHYTGKSNKFGFFYGLGQEVSNFIPVLNPINPNGDFYLITTKKENQIATLIADRNLQGGISYDTLNASSAVSGTAVTALNVLETSFTETTVSASSPFQKTWNDPLSVREIHVVRIDDRADQTMTEIEIYNENGEKITSQATFDTIGEPSNATYTANLIKSRMTDGNLTTYAWDDSPNEKGENGVRILFSNDVRISKIVIYGHNTYPMRTLRIRMMGGGDKIPIRLMSGGSSATDNSSEWNQYIVNSNLNNSIIAGDNRVWNWSERWTMTSTLSGSNVIVRGNTSSSGYGNVTTSSTNILNNNYRPLVEINIAPPATPGKSDLESLASIPYSRVSDMQSIVSIPPRGFMATKVNVTPVTKLDLPSLLSINNISDLPSRIEIPLHGFMPIKADVVQPPRTTVNIKSVQDAFVTNSNPRLNYGSTGDLLVGNNTSNNGLYRSLIQFGLSEIPPAMKITKAKMKVYFDYENMNDIPISVSALASSWVENGVTWNNQPSVSKDIGQIQVGQKRGYIELDIINLVNQWYSGEVTNNGIIMKLTDESIADIRRFYARETTSYSPLLEVEYYDPTPKSYDYGEIEGRLKINRYDKKDLSASLQIKALFENKDLKSNIHLTNLNQMLEGNINITRDQLISMIKIKLAQNESLNGAIIVSQNALNDIGASVSVNPINIPSSIVIRRNNDFNLDGRFTIKELSTEDLQSFIQVTNPDLIGKIKVLQHSSLDSYIDVKYARKSDLNSAIIVRQTKSSDMSGLIEVHHANVIDSYININSGYLASSINIPFRDFKDLPTHLNIQTFYASDLESNLNIGKFEDLNSKLEVVLGRPNNFIIYW